MCVCMCVSVSVCLCVCVHIHKPVVLLHRNVIEWYHFTTLQFDFNFVTMKRFIDFKLFIFFTDC